MIWDNLCCPNSKRFIGLGRLLVYGWPWSRWTCEGCASRLRWSQLRRALLLFVWFALFMLMMIVTTPLGSRVPPVLLFFANLVISNLAVVWFQLVIRDDG